MSKVTNIQSGSTAQYPILILERVNEDDGRITIRSPQTGVGSFGDDLLEACSAFFEALELFRDTLAENEETLGKEQLESLNFLRSVRDFQWRRK